MTVHYIQPYEDSFDKLNVHNKLFRDLIMKISFKLCKPQVGGIIFTGGVMTTGIKVLCRNRNLASLKPWMLFPELSLRKGCFTHANLHSFLKEAGAEKHFTLALGKE